MLAQLAAHVRRQAGAGGHDPGEGGQGPGDEDDEGTDRPTIVLDDNCEVSGALWANASALTPSQIM